WSGDDKPASNRARHLMALPAYDQCIKASHVFNLLDARGVISVTERQSYILRVRELAKACGEAWLATEGGGNTHERCNHAANRRPATHSDHAGRRQELLVVRLRTFQIAAVLRPLAQRHRLQSSRIQARGRRRGLVLRLQAFGQETDVRRES